MAHFIKFIFLTLFLFAFLNFFRSNMDTVVSLKFQIPLIWEWVSEPISVNFLALGIFCLGIVSAALVGAFRMGEVRQERKRLKELESKGGSGEPTPV